MQPLGGGPTGGQLAPGTYFVYYTYTYSNGTESAASPNSAYFTVVAGYIPLVTLPPLPVDATGYNIYLSDPSADPGSATRYASGITTTTWTLASAVPPAGVSPPSTASATVAPTVKPSGGGATGGHLAPGTYFVLYTFAYPNNTESFPSPSSATFAVTAGEIPQVTLPPLPAGAFGVQRLLVERFGGRGLGGQLRHAGHDASRQPGGARARPAESRRRPLRAPRSPRRSARRAAARTVASCWPAPTPCSTRSLTRTESNRLPVRPRRRSRWRRGTSRWSRCRRCPPAPRGSTSICPTPPVRSGPAVRYATGIKTTTVLLALRRAGERGRPPGQSDRDGRRDGERRPAGVPSGGKLAPGTYYLFYTFNYQGSAYPVGVESAPSPGSLPFTVAAGDDPAGLAAAAPGRRAPRRVRSATTSTCPIRRPTRTRRPATPPG